MLDVIDYRPFWKKIKLIQSEYKLKAGNLRGAQPSYTPQSYAAQPNYAQQQAAPAYAPQQAQPVAQPQQPEYNNNYNNINYVAQYQPTTANPRVHHPGENAILY